MLFFAGINKMDTEEQRRLLAQLESFNTLAVIKESATKGTLKAKNWTANQLAGLAKKAGKEDWQERIQDIDEKSNWEVIELQATIDKTMEEMQTLCDYEIRAYLKEDIAKLVGLPRTSSMDEISQKYLETLAKHFKIRNWKTLSPGELENRLYQSCLEEQLEMIKQYVRKLSPDDEGKVTELLQKEVEALSHSEQEAMRRATGLDNLTGEALLTLIKTTSALAIAQALIASTGFGAYLFLSTMLKAISLLLGVSFAFGTYAGASTVMAFFVSFPFLVMFLVGGGGLLWWRTQSKLNDFMIKAVFMAGKARLVA
ncbi:MAG: hypothetical protein ACOX4Q_00310 [Syntrophomonadales bacterium]|jgi:hypothetical protein